MMNNEELKEYTYKMIDRIADIIEEAENELSKKEFAYFKSELGNYFNEL